MDPHQISRPQSVDSVNLGSVYSGYYPTANSGLQQPNMSNPSAINYPSTNPFHQAYNNNHYGHPTTLNTQPAVPSMQYPNSINQAYYYQQQHQQQSMASYPPQPGHMLSPSQPTHQPVAAQIAAAASAAATVAFQTQQHQQHQVTSPQQAQLNGMHPSWPAQAMQMPSQHLPPTQNPGLDSQKYLNQYYRDYYTFFYRQLQHQQAVQVHQKTRATMKFSARAHAHGSFSMNDNQLVIVEANRIISLYSMRELFIERCYPVLFLQTLLNSNAENSGEESSKTLLPFNDSQVALEWIRVKLLNDRSINYELKLILKVIQMLFKQNGSISPLDLSELLFELVNAAAPSTNNNGNNSSYDQQFLSLNVESYEQLSQTGSESTATGMGSLSREQTLDRYRQLLMRGQPRVAITLAQNNGLFDHALVLSFLLSYHNGQEKIMASTAIDNSQMISTIRKFINTTLAVNDPIYVLYSHLMQSVLSGTNSTSKASTTTASSAKIDSLESFIIILANNIKFDKVEIVNNSFRHLIDLIVALLKSNLDHVLSDELFSDPLECLLVNECLELARFSGQRHNPKLFLRKLEFAFELFDFGFHRQALNYCDVISHALEQPNLTLKQLQENSTAMKASKLTKFLLPSNLMSPETDEMERENIQIVRSLWRYQMFKLTTRFDRTLDAFLPPYIADVLDKKEAKNKEKGGDEDDAKESTKPSSTKLQSTKTEETKKATVVSESASIHSFPTKPATIEENESEDESTEEVTTQNNNDASDQELSSITQDESQESSVNSTPIKTANRVTLQEEVYDNDQEAIQPQQYSNISNEVDSYQQHLEYVDGSFQSLSFAASPGPPASSTLNNQSFEREDNAFVANKPVFNFFVPPPPPATDNGPAPFDFISTGQVTSIPAYDLIEPNEKAPTQASGMNYNPGPPPPPPSQPVQYTKPRGMEPLAKELATSRNDNNKANGGLLNSLFGKLKPKNQIILPDDKEPTLVYDPVSKTWVDKAQGKGEQGQEARSGGGGAGPGGLPPPPRMPFSGGSALVNNRHARARYNGML